MPTRAEMMSSLESIANYLEQDQGLLDSVNNSDLEGGQDAAILMNGVIADAIIATGVNDDGLLSPGDLREISDYVRANSSLYEDFIVGHGNDEGNEETGFHLVQGDGGSLRFQGRQFINTTADAIYHFGFAIANGRFRNEDGDENEEVADVAGWMNYFLNGKNVVWGSSASETLNSGDYSEVFADARNEVFKAGAGDDKIWAGDGDDVVRADEGNDQSGGGDGNDIMYGGSGNDKLGGDDGKDKVYGGTGNDVVSGGDGDDRLFGGGNSDEVYGGWGEDVLYGGTAHDKMGGGEDDDYISGGAGNDTLWGEEGRDRISGDDGDDRIGGGQGSDVLAGKDGNDFIGGDTGRDRIYGGDGRDELYGGDSEDMIRGGDDNDLIGGGDGDDDIDGGRGNDELHGNDENDRIVGGVGRDLIYGGNDNDALAGNTNHDEIHGGNGNDRMYGGSGNDTLSGGSGRDMFYGGEGADLMRAWESEQSRDTFVFRPGETGMTRDERDVIEGFKSGVDKIDLSSFNDLGYIGNADFYGNGIAQVRFDNGFLKIDNDGNGRTDHIVEVMHMNALQTDDFIL